MIHLSLRKRFLWTLYTFIVLQSLSNSSCHAIRLNSNGGYDIVIGIEDDVVEPSNVNLFIDEIRVGVDAFSAELWEATNRRFFINSLDVLVPTNWWNVRDFHLATWQNLRDSELRVTHEVSAPTSVNPNPCGVSGLRIDLPDSFFETNAESKYGPVGKSLVNLWARYRFGVWEEHGIPGDTRFPYFFKRPSFEPQWEATGCSNEKLTGHFQTIDGESSDRCDIHGLDISDDCRFVPSPTNLANASLLHFHWLDGITQFCDSKTHNYGAPNRQNLFCGHRSVWDVIKESDDYKSTKSCTDILARTDFRVLKETDAPELYVLLDRGQTVTPDKVLKEAMGALLKFVSSPSMQRVNIAVGTYPHKNKGKDHYYVKDEVGWAPINQVIYDLQSVFESSADPSGPVNCDFGLAIKEVVDRVKQRNHLAGTIIMVVKRGAGTNDFGELSYEQEIIAGLKENSRIKVFAIEAQQGDHLPYSNLQSLTEATYGHYHLINDTVNTARKLEGILETIEIMLGLPSIMNSYSTWVTQKQFVNPDEIVEIPIYDKADIVQIHLTTHSSVLASDIEVDQVMGGFSSLQYIQKFEWNEHSEAYRRNVFTYIIRNPSEGSIWTLRHACNADKVQECKSFLLVLAENDYAVPSEEMFTSKSITIDISTSAEHNYLDMSHLGVRIAPFAVFAKVEMHRQRILGLDNVTALIRFKDYDGKMGDAWTVELKDDGKGLPDVSAFDGIYSGVFTPRQDGIYQIAVEARGVSSKKFYGQSFQDIRIVNQAGGLITKDQYNFGCRNSSKPRCVSGVPRGSFSRVMDMGHTVAVENALAFKPGRPMKILDFTTKIHPDFNIEFGFTSPKLFGSDAWPEEFRIYVAPKVENFLGSRQSTKLILQSEGKPPGEYVTLHYTVEEEAILYYAVEASYENQKGGFSNVVGVLPLKQPPKVVFPFTPTRDRLTTTTSRPTTSLTTPYWPTESTTTELHMTTEESEEVDPEVTSTTQQTMFSLSVSTPIPEPAGIELVSTATTSPTEDDKDFLNAILPILFSTSTTESPSASTTIDTESSRTTTNMPILFATSEEGEISTTVLPATTQLETEISTTASPATAQLETEISTTMPPVTEQMDMERSTTPPPATTEMDMEISTTPPPVTEQMDMEISTTPPPVTEQMDMERSTTPPPATTEMDMEISTTTPPMTAQTYVEITTRTSESTTFIPAPLDLIPLMGTSSTTGVPIFIESTGDKESKLIPPSETTTTTTVAPEISQELENNHLLSTTEFFSTSTTSSHPIFLNNVILDPVPSSSTAPSSTVPPMDFETAATSMPVSLLSFPTLPTTENPSTSTAEYLSSTTLGQVLDVLPFPSTSTTTVPPSLNSISTEPGAVIENEVGPTSTTAESTGIYTTTSPPEILIDANDFTMPSSTTPHLTSTNNGDIETTTASSILMQPPLLALLNTENPPASSTDNPPASSTDNPPSILEVATSQRSTDEYLDITSSTTEKALHIVELVASSFVPTHQTTESPPSKRPSLFTSTAAVFDNATPEPDSEEFVKSNLPLTTLAPVGTSTLSANEIAEFSTEPIALPLTSMNILSLLSASTENTADEITTQVSHVSSETNILDSVTVSSVSTTVMPALLSGFPSEAVILTDSTSSSTTTDKLSSIEVISSVNLDDTSVMLGFSAGSTSTTEIPNTIVSESLSQPIPSEGLSSSSTTEIPISLLDSALSLFTSTSTAVPRWLGTENLKSLHESSSSESSEATTTQIPKVSSALPFVFLTSISTTTEEPSLFTSTTTGLPMALSESRSLSVSTTTEKFAQILTTPFNPIYATTETPSDQFTPSVSTTSSSTTAMPVPSSFVESSTSTENLSWSTSTSPPPPVTSPNQEVPSLSTTTGSPIMVHIQTTSSPETTTSSTSEPTPYSIRESQSTSHMSSEEDSGSSGQAEQSVSSSLKVVFSQSLIAILVLVSIFLPEILT